MRYLLFNAAVAAALIYLFAVGDKSADTAKESAAEAMARLETLADQAASEVDRFVEHNAATAADDPAVAPVSVEPRTREIPPPRPAPKSTAAGTDVQDRGQNSPPRALRRRRPLRPCRRRRRCRCVRLRRYRPIACRRPAVPSHRRDGRNGGHPRRSG